MASILIAGATGLVGGEVLRLALSDPRVARVVAPSRRALPAHPKLDAPVVDYDALPEAAEWWRVDGVVGALGTTIAKAGSQTAFRRVDLDYTAAVARLARGHGAQAFALVSAMGADPGSRLFYSRVKGETEDAVRACGYPSLTIVRPGVLGGEREESRPLERLAKQAMTFLGPVLPRRHRVVDPIRLARVLIESALDGPRGERIVEAGELNR